MKLKNVIKIYTPTCALLHVQNKGRHNMMKLVVIIKLNFRLITKVYRMYEKIKLYLASAC